MTQWIVSLCVNVDIDTYPMYFNIPIVFITFGSVSYYYSQLPVFCFSDWMAFSFDFDI